MRIALVRAMVLLASLSLLVSPVRVQQSGQVTAASVSPADQILFLLSASPVSLSIFQGYSGWSTIVVTTFPGSVGSVSLSTKAPSGLTATIDTPTVSLPPSPATATLSITVDSGTAPGIYPVIVNGTSSGFHAIAISVTVLPAAAPTFSLVGGPASQSLTAGVNGTSIITITSLNRFAGDVKLSATVSPAGPTTSLAPSSLTLPAGGTGVATMKIITTSNTSSGNYTVVVQGSNGTISDSAAIEVFVNTSPTDFTISSGSTPLTIPAGTNATSAVFVNSLNGFTGDVKLSTTISPVGPIVSLVPSDIAVVSQGEHSSLLRLNSTSSTPPGSYVVMINATSGTLAHSASITLAVVLGAPPAFSISTTPSTIALQSGKSGNSTITLTSMNGFSGNITLSLTVIIPSTSPPTVSFSPTTVKLSSGQSANSTLTITSTGSTMSGGYNVFLQASSGTTSDAWIVQVFVNTPAVDFSLAATPTSLSVFPGEPAAFKILLTSVGGLSVTASVSNCLSCISPIAADRPRMIFDPASLTLGMNGNASSIAVVTDGTTPIGSYDLMVSVNAGAALHFISILLNVSYTAKHYTSTSVGDVSCTIPSGGSSCTASATAIVTVASAAVNSPTGAVTFALTPGATGGMLSATSCTLTITLGVTSCSVTFTGTTAGSGAITATYAGDSTHNNSTSSAATATVMVAAPPFNYALTNNGPVSITAGGSSTVIATATLTSGTSQPITFSCVSDSLPNGITCGSFTPNPVTPSPLGATSSLTVNVASSVTPGTYGFQVTGSPPGLTTTPTTVGITVMASASISVSCSPSSIDVGKFTTCTATVAGSSPSGRVGFTTTSSSGSFTPSNGYCTLSGAGCSLTYTNTGTSATVIISATYLGDTYNTAVSTTFSLTVSRPSNILAAATSSVILNSGTATADQTSTTGVSVQIAGSTATNGTPMAIDTVNLSSPDTGVGTLSLYGASYYDVVVSGITSGTAKVCFSSSSANSYTTVEYWTGIGWKSATSITVSGGTVCGTIPVSALSGTNIAVGSTLQPAPPQEMILGLSSAVFYSIVGVLVAVVVIVSAALQVRRRARMKTKF